MANLTWRLNHWPALQAIEEWRAVIVNAVQSNNPATEDELNGYRGNADDKPAVASTAVLTDPDRNVFLPKNEFDNMRELTVRYLAMRKT